LQDIAFGKLEKCIRQLHKFLHEYVAVEEQYCHVLVTALGIWIGN
jgi:hypothetical protein